MINRKLFVSLSAFLLAVLCASTPVRTQQRAVFDVRETTIAASEEALRENKVTCRQLVTTYLARIQAYDQPTRLNSTVPMALGRSSNSG